MSLKAAEPRPIRTARSPTAACLSLSAAAQGLSRKKLSSDLEEKQILDKLWDNYELSHSAAQQLRQPVENLQKESRGISDLRRQISALGTPNIGAIEEFERVNTRYEFLTGQRSDIEKAKKELFGHNKRRNQ